MALSHRPDFDTCAAIIAQNDDSVGQGNLAYPFVTSFSPRIWADLSPALLDAALEVASKPQIASKG